MAWGTAVAGALSAIGSLVGGSMANAANANLNKSNMRWQEAMTKWNQNWQEKMWQKENEYNTPLAQRQRLQEAGYNPWISGSGGMSNVSQGVPQTNSPSPPSMIPMQDVVGPAARSGVNAAMQQVQVQAQASNQLAQAAQSGVDTAVAIYEKTGDFDAASQYLGNVLSSVGGAKFSKDSMYFQMFKLRIAGLEYENTNRDLQNTYQDLQNGLVAKYGDKEASAKIANLEQLTTKYVGELGLMSSQADLNRSEIALNDKRAYELGAKAASEFAQAGLFSSEASINRGMAFYLIGNARLDYLNGLMNNAEQSADFNSRKGVRDYKVSPEGVSRQTWNYKQSPEGNYVNSFINGFTNSSKISVGVNLNRGFNTTRSFGTNHTNSWIYNGNQWYGVGR